MNYQKYYNYKLPISMNAKDYGTILFQKDNISFVKLTINSVCIIDTQINEGKTINKVKLYRKLALVLEWEDFKGTNDYTFTRRIAHMTYHYENGILKNKKGD